MNGPIDDILKLLLLINFFVYKKVNLSNIFSIQCVSQYNLLEECRKTSEKAF